MFGLLLIALFPWQSQATMDVMTSEYRQPIERAIQDCGMLKPCICYNATLDCSGNNLTSLFETFDSLVFNQQTEILLLNNNKLEEVPTIQYDLQLTEFNLSYNSIRSIHNLAFSRLALLQILDLSHNNITGVLKSLHCNIVPPLWYLSLSNNQIQTVNVSNTGSNNNCYYSLMSLNLSSNNISQLSAQGFGGFPNLTKLQIDNNQLETLNMNWFAFTTLLQSLDASSNLITQVTISETNAFKNLTFINLAKNRIEMLTTEFVFHLEALATLDISFNQLTSIKSLERLSNISLTIFAEGNPWHCSCSLNDTNNTLNDNNVTFACKNASECLYCETPASFKGVLAKDVIPCVTVIVTAEETSLNKIIGGSAAGVLLLVLISIAVFCRKRIQRKVLKSEHSGTQENEPELHTSRTTLGNSEQTNNNPSTPSAPSTTIEEQPDHPRSMALSNIASPTRPSTPLPTPPGTSIPTSFLSETDGPPALNNIKSPTRPSTPLPTPPGTPIPTSFLSETDGPPSTPHPNLQNHLTLTPNDNRKSIPLPNLPHNPTPLSVSTDSFQSFPVLNSSDKHASFLHSQENLFRQAEEDNYCVPSVFHNPKSPFKNSGLDSTASRGTSTLPSPRTSESTHPYENVYENNASLYQDNYMIVPRGQTVPLTDNVDLSLSSRANVEQPPSIPRRSTYQNLARQPQTTQRSSSISNVNPNEVYVDVDESMTLGPAPEPPNQDGTVYLEPMN